MVFGAPKCLVVILLGHFVGGFLGPSKNDNVYRVTQNKVHNLRAILYLIFEVNITKVFHVFQCIIVNEVHFMKMSFRDKYLKLRSNMENYAI